MQDELLRLRQILDELREKCPWDKVQTWQTLRKNTVEEVFELSEALLADDALEVKKELGDLLMHLLFYTKIAEEQGLFTWKQVIDQICEKLIRRHPHIYGEAVCETQEEVRKNWEQIKLTEEGQKSVLAGVPKGLTPMVKAYRLQEKTAALGFDWQNSGEVWQKVQEESRELQEATTKIDQEEELGDLLFVLINYARHLKIDPEEALHKSNEKFIRRFNALEILLKQDAKQFSEVNTADLEAYYQQAKKQEKIKP